MPPALPPADLAQQLEAALALGGRGSTAAPEAALAACLAAMKLAAQLQRPLEHGRAAELRCLHLARLGRYTEAVAAAYEALPLLQGADQQTERCAVLRTQAMAASEANAFETALAAANELVRLARDRDASTALDAAIALAACFERMGDPWQAERVLSDGLRDHGPDASTPLNLSANNCLCVIGIGMLHLLLDSQADEAELQALLLHTRAAAERARELLAQLPSPAYEAPIMGNLAEVMLHQGELAGAGALLRQALALAQQQGLQAYAWRMRISLADWHLAQAEPEHALALALGVLEEMGAHGQQQTVIRARRSAYRACRALGRFEPALQHLEVAEREELRDLTRKMRAQSELFVSRAEAQQVQWQAEDARLEAQQQRQRAAEAAASAERDPLTGLGNRRHLERRCAELLPAAGREQRPLALAQLDIDHFKSINDRCGHATGDRVLTLLAQLLQDSMRASDVVVRQGGEEFVIVMPDTDLSAATDVCERLRERVATHPWAQLGGPDWQVTVSIGLAIAAPYELAALLETADAALYRAKRGGRNRLCA
ncbi:GGDEF domain-containing protein [Roseateles violae]|uniref:diguanylate cyclase n=1 Tax=Roseateles violae TaxID=3058042 RepID=A0ABT8DK24_9BURK|nr:GGDEF domain-containing protein [Pelomonas sp. PFR6]MDN3918775.1 GGDEF domain-containing protein [Pelomonas sp. PFR6]